MKLGIPGWFGRTAMSSNDRQILNQRYKILLTKFEKIKFEGKFSPDSNTIISKLEELFNKDQNWTNLSQIEIYLVSLYNDAELAMELKINVLEAKNKLSAEQFEFYQKEARMESSASDKKILLTSLMEKLFISDDIDDLQKSYIAKTRIRTSFLFFVAIIMFFAVDQVPAIAQFLAIAKGSKGDAILTAMAAGWMGTTFSMLLGLKTKLSGSSISDLKVIHRIDYLFSRTIIGVTSGLLVFYFFQAQLLSGTFFPVFNPELPIFSDVSNALLIVWCFISGFSEKLVPDLIAKTEDTIK